jgi:two-component system, OmpR family, sensor kinase
MSIRARMTLWHVALLGGILLAAGAFLVVRLRSDLISQLDGALGPAGAQIAVDYAREGDREFVDSAGTVLKGERATAQLLAPSGAVLVHFGDAVASAPLIGARDRARALAGTPVAVTARAGGQRFRLAARSVVRGGIPAIVIVGQSLSPVEGSVRRLLTLLLIAGPLGLLAAALGGWWLARRALAPIEALTTSADAIRPERLGERVPEPRVHDELAHLARTLNAMLGRIEEGVDAQRRFVADASHELRTPLAAMRAEIDVSLRADAHPPVSEVILLSAREEVDRLAATVDDLLTLATLDECGTIDRGVVDLAETTHAVLTRLAIIAGRQSVTLADACERVLVRANPALLEHALANVVENAVAFSPPGAVVTVRTEQHGPSARLVVEDEGPGVPGALRERVFERFVRVDPSRTRATGGSGLGLAIVREVMAVHDGRAWIADPACGTRVVLELPAPALPSP